MINLIIAYDDNDSELGIYFEDSYNNIINHIADVNDLTLRSIRGLDCSEERILFEHSEIGNHQSIFIGLSHGNECQLLTDNEIYVDVNNIGHFVKSLFFTPGCRTAIDLGKRLGDNRCLCYIGCIRDTYATFEDYHDTYLDCENYCIRELLSSDKSVNTAFAEMLEKYDRTIDMLFNQKDDDILLAMELQHNKDSFIVLGNGNLRKSDLN